MSNLSLHNTKVTLMGLGVHTGGSGISTLQYLYKKGAQVTVTDLRTPEQLASTLKKLKDLEKPENPITYVLGEHREEDFIHADLVIKNPGVPKSSPYLKLAKRIETDISLFLYENKRPIIAITGSKGKSTTTALLGAVLKEHFPKTLVGGNIGNSPLNFVDQCTQPLPDPIVLELSSWQLGDIAEKRVLKPQIAIITNILPDHQNSYTSIESYRDDKISLATAMDSYDLLLLPEEDPWLQDISTHARVKYLRPDTGLVMGIPGIHNKLYGTMVQVVAAYFGIKSELVDRVMASFQGVPDRLELVDTIGGVEYINDTTATIPQATAAGVMALQDKPVHLITGGTDKNLDFTGLMDAYARATSIHLLQGSATNKLIPLLDNAKIPYYGPFLSLEETFASASALATADSRVLFSPGGSSFELFTHEFARGNAFKALVSGLKNP